MVVSIADKATPSEDPIRLSTSKNPEDRMFALFVLRKRLDEFAASDVGEVLKRLLVDPNRAVSGKAVEVVPLLPFHDASQRREVCRRIRDVVQRKTTDPDKSIAFSAQLTLVKVNEGALSHVEFRRWLVSSIAPLLDSLSKGDDKSKERAADLLRIGGRYNELATSALVERLLKSQTNAVVSATLDALREIVTTSEHARDILRSKTVSEIFNDLAKHDDEYIRFLARQLQEVGASRIPAEPSGALDLSK